METRRTMGKSHGYAFSRGEKMDAKWPSTHKEVLSFICSERKQTSALESRFPAIRLPKPQTPDSSFHWQGCVGRLFMLLATVQNGTAYGGNWLDLTKLQMHFPWSVLGCSHVQQQEMTHAWRFSLQLRIGSHPNVLLLRCCLKPWRIHKMENLIAARNEEGAGVTSSLCC